MNNISEQLGSQTSFESCWELYASLLAWELHGDQFLYSSRSVVAGGSGSVSPFQMVSTDYILRGS